ncbi:UvrB/UvrC motif-containing protein, partial [Mycobacterium tuberculosis]
SRAAAIICAVRSLIRSASSARDLQFELAARFRDEIADLKRELRGMDAAGLK